MLLRVHLAAHTHTHTHPHTPTHAHAHAQTHAHTHTHTRPGFPMVTGRSRQGTANGHHPHHLMKSSNFCAQAAELIIVTVVPYTLIMIVIHTHTHRHTHRK